jgi:tripartite-type tricarboxylate transporter receptor subunit TctC
LAAISRETQFFFGPMAGGMVPHVKAGRLKALAVGGAARSAVLPDVPTVAESGMPAYQSYGWFGLLAPAKTPQPIIMRLNKAIVEAVSAADLKQKFVDIGVDATSNSPEEFGKFIREQLSLYRKVVRELGIKFD